MEQTKVSEIAEFRSLMAAIRTESDFMKKMILSKEEEDEEHKIHRDFDSVIRTQVFGTLEHLMAYQVIGWRELVDGGDNGENEADTAQD